MNCLPSLEIHLLLSAQVVARHKPQLAHHLLREWSLALKPLLYISHNLKKVGPILMQVPMIDQGSMDLLGRWVNIRMVHSG